MPSSLWFVPPPISHYYRRRHHLARQNAGEQTSPNARQTLRFLPSTSLERNASDHLKGAKTTTPSHRATPPFGPGGLRVFAPRPCLTYKFTTVLFCPICRLCVFLYYLYIIVPATSFFASTSRIAPHPAFNSTYGLDCQSPKLTNNSNSTTCRCFDIVRATLYHTMEPSSKLAEIKLVSKYYPVANYSYPRGDDTNITYSTSRTLQDRTSVNSESSAPGLVEDRTDSEVSQDDDYQYHAHTTELWDSFWRPGG